MILSCRHSSLSSWEVTPPTPKTWPGGSYFVRTAGSTLGAVIWKRLPQGAAVPPSTWDSHSIFPEDSLQVHLFFIVS